MCEDAERTWAGFAHLALVIDVFSRHVVGWGLATHRRTDRRTATKAIEYASVASVSRPAR